MSYIQHKSEESLEDYLETILMLSLWNPVVRSIDIANELGYSKPSVSVAMKNLRQKGLIVVSPEGYITLTDAGKEIAASTYERHKILSRWLISLGIDRDVAIEDACRMEHDISPESFAAMKSFIEKNMSGDDGHDNDLYMKHNA